MQSAIVVQQCSTCVRAAVCAGDRTRGHAQARQAFCHCIAPQPTGPFGRRGNALRELQPLAPDSPQPRGDAKPVGGPPRWAPNQLSSEVAVSSCCSQFPLAPLIPNMAITCQGQINLRLENKIIFNKNTNHRASGSPGSWRLGYELVAGTDGGTPGCSLVLSRDPGWLLEWPRPGAAGCGPGEAAAPPRAPCPGCLSGRQLPAASATSLLPLHKARDLTNKVPARGRPKEINSKSDFKHRQEGKSTHRPRSPPNEPLIFIER